MKQELCFRFKIYSEDNLRNSMVDCSEEEFEDAKGDFAHVRDLDNFKKRMIEDGFTEENDWENIRIPSDKVVEYIDMVTKGENEKGLKADNIIINNATAIFIIKCYDGTEYSTKSVDMGSDVLLAWAWDTMPDMSQLIENGVVLEDYEKIDKRFK